MQDVFVPPSGQDDNLGDSALRVGLLNALRMPDQRLHVYLEGQSSDYAPGLPLRAEDVRYASRRPWLAAQRLATRPVYVLNAGEINPKAGQAFPHPARALELSNIAKNDGVIIAAGIGLKDPSVASKVHFDPALRDAQLISWRDEGSRDAAGFGDFAPDWAFSLGSAPSAWTASNNRDLIAVTMRFDRELPGERWLSAIRELAARTDTRIVTVAQVARDAPLAVRLAHDLGGEYLVAATNRHDDLDMHVREVYGRSLAVVSDRAHGLIMGATEGAYPLGTAGDPQKIKRLLSTAGVGALTGHHDDFADRSVQLEAELPTLPDAILGARRDLVGLTERIHETLRAAAV